MTVREILKMGDARLLRIAEPVQAFDAPELHALIADMRETMAAVNGAGLAAPQIGVNLQLVIFGSTARNPRYPDRPLVPPTVLINPVITPLGPEEEEDDVVRDGEEPLDDRQQAVEFRAALDLDRPVDGDLRAARHVTEAADDWPERTLRQRSWLTPTQALVRVEDRGLRELIRAVMAERAELTLEGGQVLRAKLVVGADGRESWVRQQKGLSSQHDPYNELGVVANFRTELPHFGTASK